MFDAHVAHCGCEVNAHCAEITKLMRMHGCMKAPAIFEAPVSHALNIHCSAPFHTKYLFHPPGFLQ